MFFLECRGHKKEDSVHAFDGVDNFGSIEHCFQLLSLSELKDRIILHASNRQCVMGAILK